MGGESVELMFADLNGNLIQKYIQRNNYNNAWLKHLGTVAQPAEPLIS